MKQKFVILLLVLGISRVTAQNAVKTFLESNRAELKPDLTGSPLFNDSFYRNQYFLFGETHGSALPQQYDLALFKHLHQRAGVKYYIAEVDCTKAWMINNYLQSGNTQWLDKVFSSWKKDTAQWANREYYNKFMLLYQYQRSLPPGKKVTVLGIDVPQDYSLIKEYVTHLVAHTKFEKYQVWIDTLQTVAENAPEKKELTAFCKRFLPALEADKKFFRNKLAKNYAPFMHLVTSFTFIGSGMYRDSVMYRNLVSQVELLGLQQEKMYGSLGFYHCLQTGYNHSMPFAALLKKYGHTGGITSMQMFALNSKTMIPYTAQVRQMMPRSLVDRLRQENASYAQNEKYVPYDLSNDNLMMKVEGTDNLKDLSQPNTVYLFRLQGDASPFNQTNQLSQITGFQRVELTNKTDHTTQAFQYILLFRNSDAATPLD